MTSISTVFSERGTGPYSKALKVRVVAVEGKPHNYRAKDGTEKSVLTSAMSDGGRIVKAVCYDSTKFPKFKVKYFTLPFACLTSKLWLIVEVCLNCTLYNTDTHAQFIVLQMSFTYKLCSLIKQVPCLQIAPVVLNIIQHQI